MCTVLLLRRPGHAWPALLAANRDEMLDRPWSSPARHWPERPEVVAGRDLLAGGTWLGVNNHGLVACILNRAQSLGPAPNKRSRGEIVLDALDHADAAAAAQALAALEPTAYRTFNLVLIDNRDGFWLRNTGPEENGIEVRRLPDGFSMLAETDLNDPTSPRIARYLPRFEAAPVPDPESGDWRSWERLMADTGHDPAEGPAGALSIFFENAVDGRDFGTCSSSLLALPAADRPNRRPIWLFSAARPGTVHYRPISLA